MWDASNDVTFGATTLTRSIPQGSAIWEYDGSEWNLKMIRSHGDVKGVAGDPPNVPGRFKGQLRATPCVKPTAV